MEVISLNIPTSRVVYAKCCGEKTTYTSKKMQNTHSSILESINLVGLIWLIPPKCGREKSVIQNMSFKNIQTENLIQVAIIKGYFKYGMLFNSFFKTETCSYILKLKYIQEIFWSEKKQPNDIANYISNEELVFGITKKFTTHL